MTPSHTEDPTASPEPGDRPDLMAAVPRRSLSHEALVGLFAVLGLLATLVALFTLTDAATFRGRYFLRTVVSDASGIRRGDPVQMRGVNIGRVNGFHMTDEGVAIRLEIEGEYEVPADSRVALVSSGILGGLTAQILPGQSEEEADEGDVLPGTSPGGLFDTAGDLSARADEVLAQAQQLLSPATVGAVSQSAVQLQALLTELAAIAAAERDQLRSLTASLRRSSEGLERATAGPELERIVARLDTLTVSADVATRSAQEAAASLQTVLGRIERGEGTLGRLTTDDELYERLTAAATSINLLAEDIRRQPSRYIDLKVF